VTTWPPRIGLHGHAGVGKDTLAELLRKHEYHRIGLADPLYSIVWTVNPLIGSTLPATMPPISVKMLMAKHKDSWREAKDDKFYGPGLRRFLQTLATDGIRFYLGEDTFWRVAQREIDIVGYGRVVVSDVRFDNEVQWIRRCGGIIVQITRPGYGPVNDHVADAGGLEVDFTIRNEEAPEDMLRNLEWFLSR
jgi:hypothetical protein